MRRRWATALVLAVGCGRISFDAQALGDGGSDTHDGDASSDGSVAVRVAYVKASNTETFDTFGHAIAVSGDGTTLAVSAVQEDSGGIGPGGNQSNNDQPQSGAVYVYVRTGETWVQQQYIKPANTDGNDVFGWSLALSHDGNTLAVGAPFEDSSSVGIDGNAGNVSPTFDAGAAYVFVRSGTTWSQQAYVKASNTEAGDDFGVELALSGDGNTLAVAAGLEDGAAAGIDQDETSNAAPGSGAVYVFDRAGTIWSQGAYIKASNPEVDDSFGNSVALSFNGATLAVAAKQEDSGATTINGNQGDNSVTEAGAVYVFERVAATWAQQAYIKPMRVAFGDFFGNDIALSADGNVLACSAPGEDTAIANSGVAFVFTRAATTWTQVQQRAATNAGDNDQFGNALDLSDDGNVLVVSAQFEDSGAAGFDGDQTDESKQDSGAAYVLRRSGALWQPESYLKGLVPTAGDQFGNAVAISADGSTIAVALFREDGAATGIDGAVDNNAPDSGAVYVISY